MEIFGPNNHSKFLIEWRQTDEGMKNEIRRLILEHYNFKDVGGDIGQVKEWERMSNNFRLKVKSENSWKKVLFRKQIQLKDEKSIEILDKIFVFLKKENIPIGAIIKTKDGRTNFSDSGVFYVMYEFIEGNHYRGTLKELLEAAKGIALLHKALKRIPFAEKIKEKSTLLPPWEFEGWKKIFAKAETGKDEIDSLLSKNKNLILKEAEEITKNSQKLKKLKRQMIHADLHPQNTIFREEKLTAFLDFEGLREGELLRDIGNACHRFVRQFVVFQKKDFSRTLGKGIKVFLGEYNKINPIERKEINSIPLLISDEILRKIYKDINSYYFMGDSSKVEGGELDKKITLLKESKIIKDFIK